MLLRLLQTTLLFHLLQGLFAVDAFALPFCSHGTGNNRLDSSWTDDQEDETTSSIMSQILSSNRSSLRLLEHINLNVPTQEIILSFYFDILRCGMDPRKVENLAPEK